MTKNHLQTASGKDVFPIGVGTFGIASWENPATMEERRFTGYKNVEPVYGNEEAETAGLVNWMKGGANYIDTAELYGGSYTNELIANAIADVSADIPREDLFVSGNVWKSNYGNVPGAVRAMLGKLGLEYLDTAGLHSPHTNGWDVPDWQQAIRGFAELKDEGLVHGLSVSNFTVGHMERAMDLTELPITTAHMGFSVGYRQEVTPEFLAYCHRNNIQIVAYQPLQPDIIGVEAVKDIASLRCATPAQVALAWTIRMGTLPITKTIKPERIAENLAGADLHLTDEDMNQLDLPLV